MPEIDAADIDKVRQTRLKSKVNAIASESLDKSLERTKREIELDKLKDQEWEAIDAARKQLHDLQETILQREKALQNTEIENMRTRYQEIMGNAITRNNRRSVTIAGANQNINTEQYVPTASSPLHEPPRNNLYQNQTTLPNQTQVTSSFYSRPKDIGETIRRWNIKFSADGTKSIQKFLEDIDRRASLFSVTSEELLLALPDMLEGKAKIWYSAMYRLWNSWDQFKRDAISHYGAGKEYQQKLETEFMSRTQGEDEDVRTYMFSLLAIAEEFRPRISDDRKLDMLYRNIKPEIKKLLFSKEIKNIDTFITEAIRVEELLKSGNLPPPPPREACLFPEASYTPPKKDRPKNTLNQISAVSAADVKEIVSAELAAIIQDTKFSMRELRIGKDCYGANGSDSDDYDEEPRRPQRKTTPKQQKGYSNQNYSQNNNQNRNYPNNNNYSNNYTPRNNQQPVKNYNNQQPSNQQNRGYNTQQQYSQPNRSYNNQQNYQKYSQNNNNSQNYQRTNQNYNNQAQQSQNQNTGTRAANSTQIKQENQRAGQTNQGTSQNQQQASGQEERVPKCPNCGEIGHRRNDCPKPLVFKCYTCGSPDHLKYNCPQNLNRQRDA